MISTLRKDGRASNEMRAVRIETGVARYAEGSALIAFGETQVWCTASVEEKVPPFLEGKRRGWVTGEYAMLPRATNTRISWERSIQSGRSQEISRLIGRALRAAVDMHALGERTITIDCVVQQADGGTRTASITGGYVALALACGHLQRRGLLKRDPLTLPVAAISAGLVENAVHLDLDYREDSRAQADCNVVMNGRGGLIELQGTGEERAFSRAELEQILDFATPAIQQLTMLQRAAIEEGRSQT